MPIYEKRTYDIKVGHMTEVIRLYGDEGAPALEAGGFMENLVGYFTSDTGRLHQLIHIWRLRRRSPQRFLEAALRRRRIHEVRRADPPTHRSPRRPAAQPRAVGTKPVTNPVPR